MKKLLIIAAIAFSCGFGSAPRATAQAARFDFSGIPTTPLQPGATFTVSASIVFTAGGNMMQLVWVSYWLWQPAPESSFPFSLIDLDPTGSPFVNGHSTPSFPQIIDPISRNSDGTLFGNDLGGFTTRTLGSGTYFVAKLTFAISSTAFEANYFLGNTTTATPGVGGRRSEAGDDGSGSVQIADSRFAIAIVPEPGAATLLALGSLVLIWRASRKRRLNA